MQEDLSCWKPVHIKPIFSLYNHRFCDFFTENTLITSKTDFIIAFAAKNHRYWENQIQK